MKTLPPNYVDIAQNTPEWLQTRVGLVTASHVGDVVKKLKNGSYSKERENYMMDKLQELLTGLTSETYVSAAMEFGIDNEPLARTAYELSRGVDVERIGFIHHESISRSGASPDGLVGDDGLLEIKVPNTKTHLQYLLAGVVPEEYKPQMFWQMACADRKYCDFCSYDPRLPEDFALFIVRLDRDDKIIAEMEAEVIKFIAELNEMCEKLQAHAKTVPHVTAGPAPERAEIPAWQEIT